MTFSLKICLFVCCCFYIYLFSHIVSVFFSFHRDGWDMMKRTALLHPLAASVPVALLRAWCPFSQHLSSWTRRTSCTQRALSWRAPNTVWPVLHSPITWRYEWTKFLVYIFTRHCLFSCQMYRSAYDIKHKPLDSFGTCFLLYGYVRALAIHTVIIVNCNSLLRSCTP